MPQVPGARHRAGARHGLPPEVKQRLAGVGYEIPAMKRDEETGAKAESRSGLGGSY
jgi:hypothetical protein